MTTNVPATTETVAWTCKLESEDNLIHFRVGKFHVKYERYDTIIQKYITSIVKGLAHGDYAVASNGALVHTDSRAVVPYPYEEVLDEPVAEADATGSPDDEEPVEDIDLTVNEHNGVTYRKPRKYPPFKSKKRRNDAIEKIDIAECEYRKRKAPRWIAARGGWCANCNRNSKGEIVLWFPTPCSLIYCEACGHDVITAKDACQRPGNTAGEALERQKKESDPELKKQERIEDTLEGFKWLYTHLPKDKYEQFLAKVVAIAKGVDADRVA